MQKVLQPLYFAREDTRSPFRFALVAMLVNAVLAIGLAFFVGYLAAAIATSAAGWVMVWLLWRGARPMGDTARFDARFVARSKLIALASVGMGLILYLANYLLGPALNMAGWRYPALAALVAIGMIGFFAISQINGAFRLSELRASLRR